MLHSTDNLLLIIIYLLCIPNTLLCNSIRQLGVSLLHFVWHWWEANLHSFKICNYTVLWSECFETCLFKESISKWAIQWCHLLCIIRKHSMNILWSVTQIIFFLSMNFINIVFVPLYVEPTMKMICYIGCTCRTFPWHMTDLKCYVYMSYIWQYLTYLCSKFSLYWPLSIIFHFLYNCDIFSVL